MIYWVFAVNLLITSLVEGLAIFLLYRKWDFTYYSLLCNLLTNPAMNLLLFLAVKTLGSSFYGTALVVLEITVVLVEAFIYKLLGGLKITRALLLSALLNVLSYLCGLWIWPFVIPR